MGKNTTEKLENILKSAYDFEAGKYLRENKESLLLDKNLFQHICES